MTLNTMTQNTITHILRQTAGQLTEIADDPLREAEILLAFTLGKPRAFLYASREQEVTEEQLKQLNKYVKRRSDREPIAYITGSREFWSLELAITANTLIPRPETELLVEAVLTRMDTKNKNIRLADLGTGSGAIALALAHEQPTWQIVATDIDEKALQIAQNNAQHLGIRNVSFMQGDWCGAFRPWGNHYLSTFDIIVSNPPYIAETEWATYAEGLRFEPYHALVSGIDGLEAIRTIIQSAKDYLKHGGYMAIEHGFLQGHAVRAIFSQEGYLNIYSICDLAGKERVTVGMVSKRAFSASIL